MALSELGFGDKRPVVGRFVGGPRDGEPVHNNSPLLTHLDLGTGRQTVYLREEIGGNTVWICHGGELRIGVLQEEAK